MAGQASISTEILARYAADAAREVEGVRGLADSPLPRRHAVRVSGANGAVRGLAPDSRLVNVKVGAANGTVDVSQIIAAIDWVVQHKNDNGLNVRVLNLSVGTDSDQRTRAQGGERERAAERSEQRHPRDRNRTVMFAKVTRRRTSDGSSRARRWPSAGRARRRRRPSTRR